jgi:Mrp family chromosome partitioning ATPase
LGLVLGILLAAVFSMVDRRLRDPSEVAAVLQGPILGAIPRSRSVRKTWLQNGKHLKGIDRESFAMVYANMSYYTEQPVRSVLVTSATTGEGKSTVAWNLALIAARSGARVLLIEADLRRPAFSSRMKIQPSAGLSDVLQSYIDPVDVLLPVPLNGKDAGQNGSGGHNGNGAEGPTGSLSVLLAGPNSPALSGSTPLALLGSDRMRSVLESAERLHDLVVIDGPPTCLVSDAIPLIKLVSGVLVVTRVRKNTRESARQLRDQLANLRARNLGVVVNGVDALDGYEDSAPAHLGS